MNSYPQYTVHWKTGHGELIKRFMFNTPIQQHETTEHPYIKLQEGGNLTLEEGYAWDFGSGPAIDTPDMVYASLAHDAFYELMQLGMLPWSQRECVDKYFKRLLKVAGMGWARRQWVYLGVRIGYPLTKFFAK